MKSFLIVILLFLCLNVSAQEFDLIPYRKGKLYGYVPRNSSKLVIEPQFEEANLFSCGRALVKQKGKYGFIDKQGKFVVQPVYKEAWDYQFNCAFVKDKDDIYSLLNTEGKVLLGEIEAINKYDFFSEGYQPVKKNGKYGLIDTLGNVVVPFSFYLLNPVKYGMSVARIDPATFGIVSVKGDTLVPFELSMIFPYNKEPILRFDHKDGRKGFITVEGKMIFLNNSYGSIGGFYEGLAHLKKGGRYGFIDSLGKIVIPVQYEGVKRFDQGLCAAEKGGKWGVIDREGNTVVPFQFNMIFGCSDGICEAYGTGGAGYVNTEGKLIIPHSFSRGHKFKGNIAAVEKNGKVALINRKGEMVTDFSYDVKQYDVHIPKDGVIWLWKNGNYGLVNDKGVELTEFKYNRTHQPVLGLILAGRVVKGKDWKWGALDINGKEVSPFVFSSITIYNEEKLIMGKVSKGMDIKEGVIFMEANGFKYYED